MLYSLCGCMCVQELPVRVMLTHVSYPRVLMEPPAPLWLTPLCVPVHLTSPGLSVM